MLICVFCYQWNARSTFVPCEPKKNRVETEGRQRHAIACYFATYHKRGAVIHIRTDGDTQYIAFDPVQQHYVFIKQELLHV